MFAREHAESEGRKCEALAKLASCKAQLNALERGITEATSAAARDERVAREVLHPACVEGRGVCTQLRSIASSLFRGDKEPTSPRFIAAGNGNGGDGDGGGGGLSPEDEDKLETLAASHARCAALSQRLSKVLGELTGGNPVTAAAAAAAAAASPSSGPQRSGSLTPPPSLPSLRAECESLEEYCLGEMGKIGGLWEAVVRWDKGFCASGLGGMGEDDWEGLFPGTQPPSEDWEVAISQIVGTKEEEEEGEGEQEVVKKTSVVASLPGLGPRARKLLLATRSRLLVLRTAVDSLRAFETACSDVKSRERLEASLVARGRSLEEERGRLLRSIQIEERGSEESLKKLGTLRPLVESLREKATSLSALNASLAARSAATLDELQMCSREILAAAR